MAKHTIAVNTFANSMTLKRVILAGTCQAGEDVTIKLNDVDVTALSRTRNGFWTCTLHKYDHNKQNKFNIATASDSVSFQNQFASLTPPFELDIDEFTYDPQTGTATMSGPCGAGQ